MPWIGFINWISRQTGMSTTLSHEVQLITQLFFTQLTLIFISGPSESGFKEFEKWKKYAFTFIQEVKSEKFWLSLFFEKCKVKRFCFHSFSRSESEMKMTRDRDEVKFLESFREISRNEILTSFFLPKSSLKYGLKKCKVDFLSHDLTLLSKMQENMAEVEWQTELVFTLFFSRNRSEKYKAFTFFEKWKDNPFEKWKWNLNGPRLRTRSEICKKYSRILDKRDSRWGRFHRLLFVYVSICIYICQLCFMTNMNVTNKGKKCTFKCAILDILDALRRFLSFGICICQLCFMTKFNVTNTQQGNLHLMCYFGYFMLWEEALRHINM